MSARPASLAARLLACAWLSAAGVLGAGEPRTSEGFPVPEAGHVFRFPRDHGSHPDFKIEWWYVTGHAYAAGGRRFGFEATFFRSAAPRDGAGAAGSADFGAGQVYLAHMALLDVRTGRFLHEERLNREGWDAGSAVERLAVHNGPWSLEMAPAPGEGMTLSGGIRSEAAFSFHLEPRKPLVEFGDHGYSRKGAAASAASYYLTFPRLELSGTLRYGAETLDVKGEAWMDHEVSSSQLDPGQVGWDWACLQLGDGTEMMCYRMRRADGTVDPFSTLSLVDRQGRVESVGPAGFRWEVLDTWKSPATGAVYPVRVRLTVGARAGKPARVLLLEPLARDQELAGGAGGIPYWEGACRVTDGSGADLGSAFLELTGYAGRLRL